MQIVFLDPRKNKVYPLIDLRRWICFGVDDTSNICTWETSVRLLGLVVAEVAGGAVAFIVVGSSAA